jgi:hypothetical protein
MQNQEFSEEYYKMKYFKYRAKYEQLKEIAQARSGLQTGGAAMENLGPAPGPILGPVPGPILGPVPGPNNQPQLQQPQQPQQPRGSYMPSFSSVTKAFGMDKESMKIKEEKKQQTSDDIKKLLEEIYAFASANMEENKKERLRVRLESPCTTAKLIQYINNAPMPKQQTFTLEEANKFLIKNQEIKSDLIAKVNKMCKTTLGGLNEACTMPDLDKEELAKEQAKAQTQNGGYTLTPDSLDDINTEF